MKAIPAIAIFDVGKTNKKVLLFDEQYKLVHEESIQLPETKDQDSFPCEDIDALSKWVWEKFCHFSAWDNIKLRGVNFSAYGASFVHLDSNHKPITPLYNYLKPYPEVLKKKFYDTYGSESLIAKQTASPVLGSLNSGMQLYRLKHEQPKIYEQIKYSLHLPQYLSFILTSTFTTDLTSIGCHTQLWDFQKHHYHRWVKKEGLDSKFAPIFNSDKVVHVSKNDITVGIGLHDSSAALIPYLAAFHEPFALLSTGTWCISLNPFNHSLLTDYELHQDCLCYITYDGKPVKASRLFAGYEHEQQVKRLAEHFNKNIDCYKSVAYDSEIIHHLHPSITKGSAKDDAMTGYSFFAERDLHDFKTYEEAYHQLISDIIQQQVHSLKLVLNGTSVKRIFVDGGFSRNSIFMFMLADAFPQLEVFAAAVAQASALGAALAIHQHWNQKGLPADLIELKYYTVTENISR